MLRATAYGLRAGVKDVTRSPVLLSATVVVVGLATLFSLLAPPLNELVEVGGTATVSGSEVIVDLSSALSDEGIQATEAELRGLPGVAEVRQALPGDLAATKRGLEIGEDLTLIRTVVLDGSVSMEEVAPMADQVPGVERVELGVGVSMGWTIALVELVVPWLAVLFAVAGFIAIANLSLASARTRRDEASVMRLVGASWPVVWRASEG